MAEAPLDHDQLGLDRESVVNCDGLHTVPQAIFTEFAAAVDQRTMNRVCAAFSYTHGR